MERRANEPTFIDAAVADLGGPKTRAFLDRCNRLIPWDQLAAEIKHLTPEQPKGGRPFWPGLLMLKCLMLAKWFNLSDVQLEEQLRDRISFRQFLGLTMEDATPDETTFVVFRNRLREAGCATILFDKVVSILNEKGVILKEGSLVDATLIHAPKGHKTTDNQGLPRDTRDPAATHTKKGGVPYHGFKAHIVTDCRGTILDYVFDTASPHDSNHFDQLTRQTSGVVYADSAYRSADREEALTQRGIRSMICHKRVRGQKELSDQQQSHNTACAKVRARVEHAFAWMSRMGLKAVRYRGMSRNGMNFALMAMAYNLKHSFHRLSPAIA